MRLTLVPLALLGAMSLTGCSALATGNAVPSPGKATLQVQPHIQAGGLSVQSVVNPYDATDIDHLVIKVFTFSDFIERPVLGANGVQVQKDIAHDDLGAPVVFTRLDVNTHYRIRAYAYADAATASLISTTDFGSYTDIVLEDDDRPTVASLRVKLVDKPFNGQATASGVVITSGHLATSSFEAID